MPTRPNDAPPGHLLSSAAEVAPEALRTEWFIVREEGSGTRSLSDAFFRGAGFLPRIAMETSSNEMIKQAVMAGMGLALLSQHTIALEHALGLLSVLPVARFPLQRAWFVAHVAPRDFLVEQGAAVIEELTEAGIRRRAQPPAPT